MTNTPITAQYAAFGRDYPQQRVVPERVAKQLEIRVGELEAALKQIAAEMPNRVGDIARKALEGGAP